MLWRNLYRVALCRLASWWLSEGKTRRGGLTLPDRLTLDQVFWQASDLPDRLHARPAAATALRPTVSLADKSALPPYSKAKRSDKSAISDQDIRNEGWSAPSSSENSTGIISFVAILPFKSFSARRSCWASGKPTGTTILPPALS
jgi:hypothetical protein